MILAFELSSRRGSVALHDGARVIAQQTWDEPAARHQALFTAVPRVLQEGGANWSHLRALAVGRGPGSFSGIRVALMTAQTFARPLLTPVLAVSSGEALAMDLATESDGQPIVIAGDARRGAIWYAVFQPHGSGVRREQDWTLVPAADFTARLPHGARVASPDWARLAAACGPRDTAVTWIEEDRYPSANRVAEWAWACLRANEPGEPVEPLYLHAAV